jgi:hypothetical protein
VTSVIEEAMHELGGDLADEVLGRNHVTVQKFAATRERGRLIRRLVAEHTGEHAQATIPGLALADKIRVLRGEKPIYLPELLRRGGGELIAVAFNLRTNVGIDFVYGQLSGTSVLVADTLALSNNTLAVAAADTSATLPWSTAQATDVAAGTGTGEWTGLGLTRKVATTNSHTGSATTYSLAATWTATAASTATSKIGLFGGALKASQSSGATDILVLANTFTATTLATNDQLTVTWTITI